MDRLARGALTTVPTTYGDFPTAAAILFGLGLGGFFDGIVFHQVLQWHHMVSGWYPPTTLANLRLNTKWDGAFHSLTYLFVVAGMMLFWRTASRRQIYWSKDMLFGGVLIGWGAFNLIEGVVDHLVLGVHRVNETVPAEQRWIWDTLFLVWGLAMALAGRWFRHRGERRRVRERDVPASARGRI